MSEQPSPPSLVSNLTAAKGYRRVKERHPQVVEHIEYFNHWLEKVEEFLYWIETNIPNGAYASKKEILEEYFISPQGLALIEKLNLDIYDDRDGSRTYYDVKKVMRAIVALPTITRLRGKKLVREGTRISTILKEVLDDTLNGAGNMSCISDWEPNLKPLASVQLTDAEVDQFFGELTGPGNWQSLVTKLQNQFDPETKLIYFERADLDRYAQYAPLLSSHPDPLPLFELIRRRIEPNLHKLND